MTAELPALLNLTLLVIPAFCMLLCVHILYGHRRTMNSFRRSFTLVAYGLLFIAAFGFVGGIFAAASILIWPVSIFVLIAIWIRYRRDEDSGLLAGLALAAEEQIPLVDMAAAFAAERRGGRARRVQWALSRGMSLSQALRAGGVALPAGARAAIALGEQRGELGPLLRESLEPFASFDAGLNRFVQRCLIWLVLVGQGTTVYLFIALNIIPVYARMGDEFGVDVFPPQFIEFLRPTVRFYLSSQFSWPLIVFVTLTFPILLIQQLGFSPNWLPFVTWLRRRYDSAVILHTLAAGLRANLPLPTVLRLLSETHTVGSIRSKLRKSLARTERGEDGWKCLQSYGLLRPRETAALQAAGRVGNLAFVLTELSKTILRRLEFRLHVGANVMHTIGLISLGTLAVVATISVIYPLAELIRGVAGIQP